MTSNLPHERSGCFSGLLAGSRRQRACQHAPRQGESAPRASSPGKALPEELPGYVRIASSCDFGSAKRETGHPPPYSWATSEKDYMADAMRTIEDTLRELGPELRKLSLDIHDHPELRFEERYAHDRLTEFMSSRGFTVTRHYLGLATAWRAEFKRGVRGRTVGVNAEMDALPGIGHACGHNLIAMAGVGVALALRAALEKHDVPGTVVLLGTPAEESGAGKQILMDRGAYNDMDVCIMCHPTAGETQEMGFVSSLALQSLSVEYFGQAAHAGYAPWDGVNALDAAFVAYAGISALRQQIRPEQRVHGVISGRDWAPNVIPDYAKVSWSVRAETRDALEKLRERVGIHSRTHAHAVGEPCERYLDLRQNPVLGGPTNHIPDLLNECPLLAEDLSSTAHRCYGIPSYWSTSPASASTDFGNVSHALPALHPIFTIPSPDGAQNHSPGFARAARSEAAHTAALRTAALLAHTGFRVHSDGAFCARVRAAYDAGTDAAAAGASAGTTTGRQYEITTA
ncbi:hypothetical protein EDB92DRAFT_1939845 [Lactarius akahatsu]|uniref:Peptidase M20 dimerisation domain-containing protein n=1 Tax=Lactarius akahatsu TaxID=416441 RepID=A0AAD4LRT8_9AGAM|nr:hypothetical protein EDB92DRAFT_1939845 [Lactarius akahatsu]